MISLDLGSPLIKIPPQDILNGQIGIGVFSAQGHF